MSSHRMLGRVMRWLLVGLVPACLMSWTRSPAKFAVAAGEARFEFLTPQSLTSSGSAAGMPG